MSLCLLSGLGVGAAAAALMYYALLLPLHRARCRRRLGVAPDALTVAFFHPYWCVREPTCMRLHTPCFNSTHPHH